MPQQNYLEDHWTFGDNLVLVILGKPHRMIQEERTKDGLDYWYWNPLPEPLIYSFQSSCV